MAAGDLSQVLELPLTPDGKLDLTNLNTILRQMQERVFALEGRTQPSQIRDDLEVLGDISATGGLIAAGGDVSIGPVPLEAIDPSLSPLTDASLAPQALGWTDRVASADLLSPFSPFTFSIKDEFAGQGSTTGIIGEQGWALSGGTVSVGVANQAHPGFVNLSSAGPAVARITLQGFFPADLGYAAALLSTDTSTVADTNIAFGFSAGNPAAGVEVVQGAYFSYVEATSPNWRTYTRDGAGVTTNTTDVPVVANSWYLLELVLDITASSQTVDFYINRTRAFRHTTNVLTSSMTPIFICQTTAAVTRTIMPAKYILTGKTPLSARVWT